MSWVDARFVEEITINGKVFELADARESFRCVSSQLGAARHLRAKAKVRPAKFLLAADRLGVAKLTPNMKSYCISLCGS